MPVADTKINNSRTQSLSTILPPFDPYNRKAVVGGRNESSLIPNRNSVYTEATAAGSQSQL